MQQFDTPSDLVKQLISNFEKRQRNLGKRKLQKGETLKDEQKMAVDSYDGVVQSIYLMQETILNVKELLLNVEQSEHKQASNFELEHEQHTIASLNIHLILQHFLDSLDNPNVRNAVLRASSETQLCLLDTLRTFLSSPLKSISTDLPPNSSKTPSMSSFLNSHKELNNVSTNNSNFISGKSIIIPFDDTLETVKKAFSFKDARNLCFKLLGNRLVQESLHNKLESVNEVQDLLCKDSDNVQKPKEIFEAPPTPDYVHVESPCIQSIDEPVVDKVMKPMSSTFNFLQASRVTNTHIINQSENFDEGLFSANPGQITVDTTDLKAPNVEKDLNTVFDDTYHPVDAVLYNDNILNDLSVTHNEPSAAAQHILSESFVHVSVNDSKPKSYADSVRKTSQMQMNLQKQLVTDTIPVSKVERNREEFSQKNILSNGISRGRGRFEFRGGRGGGIRRNTFNRGNGNFGQRGNAHRVLTSTVPQPTY